MQLKTRKILKILGIILISIFVLVSTVPYLIPLPETNATRTKEELTKSEGKYLDIGGKNLYYEDYNSTGEKGNIILVHGFGGSTFTYRNNISYLTDLDYRVVAVDLLGYGLSDKDYQSDYSHAIHANRLNNLLEKIEINKATFIGHSMGGSIVTHFVHLHPEKADKLILAAPAIDTQKTEVHLDTARIFSPLLLYPPFQRIARLSLRGYFFPDRVDKVLASAYFNQALLSQEIYQGYADRIVTGDWDLALLASTRDYSYNVIKFPLSDIDNKILIIAGKEDTWVPLDEIMQLRDEFENAELKVIAGSGHLPMEEKPEEFNQLVNEFLKTE